MYLVQQLQCRRRCRCVQRNWRTLPHSKRSQGRSSTDDGGRWLVRLVPYVDGGKLGFAIPSLRQAGFETPMRPHSESEICTTYLLKTHAQTKQQMIWCPRTQQPFKTRSPNRRRIGKNRAPDPHAQSAAHMVPQLLPRWHNAPKAPRSRH